MFVDLWGWFNHYREAANQSGDALKQRLVALAYEGWEYRRLADGEKAIHAFEEGRKIAQQLHEPCWEVFYQLWIAVIHLYVHYDYQNTLDSSVKLVAEIRKAKYQDCPVNASIVFILAKIYYLLDYKAYESEIVALMDYIENELGMDEDTYLQMLATRAEIEMSHGRYVEAQDQLQILISHSSDKPFRLYDAYRLLRRIDFIQGELAAALEHNRLAQKQAEASLIKDSIANEKIWEAVFLKYLGDDASAREKYYLALAYYEQYQLPFDGEYQLANLEYLELDRQLDEVLKVHEALLPLANDKPSIANQVNAYCAYIAFLGRIGKDFSAPLAAAKSIVQNSSKADEYLERLSWIEAGNYFEYEWQKKSIKNRSGRD